MEKPDGKLAYVDGNSGVVVFQGASRKQFDDYASKMNEIKAHAHKIRTEHTITPDPRVLTIEARAAMRSWIQESEATRQIYSMLAPSIEEIITLWKSLLEQ